MSDTSFHHRGQNVLLLMSVLLYQPRYLALAPVRLSAPKALLEFATCVSIQLRDIIIMFKHFCQLLPSIQPSCQNLTTLMHFWCTCKECNNNRFTNMNGAGVNRSININNNNEFKVVRITHRQPKCLRVCVLPFRVQTWH